MNNVFPETGFYPADILLPRNADLSRWAVVACDQFTSQPEYWETVEQTVAGMPSALRLILPEAKLNSPDVNRHIAEIHQTMETYLHNGTFETLPDSMIYVERTQSDGKIRHGLVGAVDLEQYDFMPGSHKLIRATEGTVLSRIPPRVRVRENAALEISHVMLLMDDPENTVMEPLQSHAGMRPLYDVALMCGGGSVRGWALTPEQIQQTETALSALCTPDAMEKKYGLRNAFPLLFAVGDGNHSLASAKQCYENHKKITPESQWATLPDRYALVEIVNSHDDALEFEPIHRVLFGVNPDDFTAAFFHAYPDACEGHGTGHTIEFFRQGHSTFITVPDPAAQLAVGTLQSVIDDYLNAHSGSVDYIHGEQTARDLGNRPGNMAFLLPAMKKEQLFKTVIADGVLPRKTFSMGNAEDKRYYLEARKIR